MCVGEQILAILMLNFRVSGVKEKGGGLSLRVVGWFPWRLNVPDL